MNFDYYPSIDNINDSLRTRYVSSNMPIKCDWYITEMLDGAHLALYANHKEGFFAAASRNKFLSDTDSYYNYKETAALHKTWVMALSKLVKSPITVYGTMIGGKYKNQSLGTKINSVCEYMPHNDFVVHDIKMIGGFISGKELITCSQRHTFTLAPILYHGNFSKVWNYPENNLSAVPFLQELPIKLSNEMKGIVVRPIFSLKAHHSFMIAKKLNRKYIGKKEDATPLIVTDLLVEIADEMENKATKLCILDAIMIACEGFDFAEINKIAGRYAQRIISQVDNLEYNALTLNEKYLVNRELNRIAKEKLTMFYRFNKQACKGS